MLYDVKSPEEYLNQLPDDWRHEKVIALREIIIDKGPKLTEKINYSTISLVRIKMQQKNDSSFSKGKRLQF